jgi:hypothetical protein
LISLKDAIRFKPKVGRTDARNENLFCRLSKIEVFPALSIPAKIVLVFSPVAILPLF